ncbi:aromatic-ring-hydroxylating dioxygenase subunit beta [Nocardioides sp.]|uniref:aromatic-ring-hydroxylating dioxygenase subunit beta n=1 Tax=Nocardioides sp. TaxID=35761 RepID=UPI0039E2804E
MPETLAAVSLTDARVVRAVELIWREAELLDRKDYHAWADLYAEDAYYVIPVDTTTEDFENSLNMVYDDARLRAMRVTRMTEGYALAAVDAAATVRTVSRIVPAEVGDDEVTLRAGQVLVAYKRGSHELWAADLDYRIRLGAGPAEDRIVRKVIRLVNADDIVASTGFLL